MNSLASPQEVGIFDPNIVKVTAVAPVVYIEGAEGVMDVIVAKKEDT